MLTILFYVCVFVLFFLHLFLVRCMYNIIQFQGKNYKLEIKNGRLFIAIYTK